MRATGAGEMRAQTVALDKRHVWHPYTPMQQYIANVDPLVITRAKGVYLEDANGRRYIDGNSSWWVAALGHGHPRLLRALANQAETLAHCALAGITHEPAAKLAEELVAVAPRGLNHVFYSDNGSTAIEVAVRMAGQMWQQVGQPRKKRFVALEGAFHGDTLGAACLGGIDVFRGGMGGVTFDLVRLPVVGSGQGDGAYAAGYEAIAGVISRCSDEIAAVVVEPIVQGAAGMRIVPPEYLKQVSNACARHDVLLIADEVFSGYGRTGAMWGCEHAGVVPDIMCIGKAFASIIPMAATLASDRVFEAFLGDKSQALYYGHTFSGNPIGAALAREVLAIYRDEKVLEQVARNAPVIARAFERISAIRGVTRVRSIGMIGAADLEAPVSSDEGGARGGYFGEIGWRVYEEGLKRGAYLRPLGSTVYVAPPLVISERELTELMTIFEESVRAALK